MSDRPNNHGHAAYVRADVEQAKRGRPSADLSGYAAQRDLEFIGDRVAAGLKGAQPVFPEYQFNGMRGELANGLYGVLLHELFEIPAAGGIAMPGSYHGVYTKRGGLLRGLIPNRADIPVIGDFLDPADDKTPVKPFESESVWIPCTIAGIPVPQAIAAAPFFFVRQGERLTLQFRRQAHPLEAYGAPGWYLRARPEASEDFVGRFVEAGVAEVLRGHDQGYADITFDHGVVRFRRNSFVEDAADLDRHVAETAAIARALAAAGAASAAPNPFAVELPAPVWEDSELPIPWAQAFIDMAKRMGLDHEDPLEFHRAFPDLPAPGRAVAVMRGEGYRLVYYAEHDVARKQLVRGGVVLPASGQADTPPGGERLAERKLVYEVRGELAAIWSLEVWGWRFANEDTVLTRALELARDRGLATAT